MSEPPMGVQVGVDYGQARIGVARCDPAGVLATPLATVPAGESEVEDVARLVEEVGAVRVIVGLPLSLDGHEGRAALTARDFAERLAARVSVPVAMIDERNTTREAARAMSAAGRSAKRQRAVIDQQAAVVLLQHALAAAQMGRIQPIDPYGLSSTERREGPSPK